MVGYSEKDSLTEKDKVIAGSVSGITSRFVTQPLDVIKVKTQLQKKQKQMYTFMGLAKNIVREEGVLALWYGHNVGQIYSILSMTSQFYLYELATQYVTRHQPEGFDLKNHKGFTTFVCGTMAGCGTATLMAPLEMIRLRQMIVKKQYASLISAARAVYATGGFFGFYKGISASMMQTGIAIGISFTVFARMQNLILTMITNQCTNEECHHAAGNTYHPQYLLVSSALAGCTAGFLSKTLTYPFDLVKRRLQIATHKEDTKIKPPSTSQNLVKCQRLGECLKATYDNEGLRGLFRGWSITMYKSVLTSLIAFSTYELTCYALREANNPDRPKKK